MNIQETFELIKLL